jgi:hypothetical protein
MDIEKTKVLIDEIFEKRPTKDVFEKCLVELVNEKNKIILREDNKNLIDQLDKLIESIQIYLSIDSK